MNTTLGWPGFHLFLHLGMSGCYPYQGVLLTTGM